MDRQEIEEQLKLVNEDLDSRRKSPPDQLRMVSVWKIVRGYLLFLVFVTLGFYLHQESKSPKTALGQFLRHKLGHHDMHEFLS